VIPVCAAESATDNQRPASLALAEDNGRVAAAFAAALTQ
jgi:hypothetical protein